MDRLNELDERELVKLAQAGEREAFRVLFERHKRRAFHVAFAVLRSKEDAEDVVQEANTRVSSRWLLGANNRNVGSIHSDIWYGTAAELATSNLIAVYPTTGWWKGRPNLKRGDSKIRYSLVVSISTPKTDVDLYNMVMTEIRSEIEVML